MRPSEASCVVFLPGILSGFRGMIRAAPFLMGTLHDLRRMAMLVPSHQLTDAQEIGIVGIGWLLSLHGKPGLTGAVSDN